MMDQAESDPVGQEPNQAQGEKKSVPNDDANYEDLVAPNQPEKQMYAHSRFMETTALNKKRI